MMVLFKLVLQLVMIFSFSGLDEEILGCWMQSLEDILETNQEAVEKAKKYEFLKRDHERLNQKWCQFKSYYDNLMKSNGYSAFQEPYGPNDTQMDPCSRTW